MTVSSVNLCIDPTYGWRKQSMGTVDVYSRDHSDITQKFLELSAKRNDDLKPGDFSKILKKIDDYSGGIMLDGDLVMAWADHIRSYPVYYAVVDKTLIIGNDARAVKTKANIETPDEKSATEFFMSGFVAGKRTLFEGLYVLQPGEFLLWDNKNRKLKLTRYYNYVPKPEKARSKDEYADALDDVMNDITQKLIKRYEGRQLVFPLSGGLDSRVLLCKFHELGYRNITTFSYGPNFNFEAGRAHKVARKLGVPWRFLHLSGRRAREMFESDERRDYWAYADGLKAAPSMREYTALKLLHEQGAFPLDAVMINGQSGDYITGNHIAPRWEHEKEELGKEALFQVLENKHYTLWPALNTDQNLAVIQERIEEITKLPDDKQPAAVWALMEEDWEYDVRQICLVTNGQRSYEYFGYDWEMPLWEKSLCDFFETMPVELKYRQNFYKYYLQRYNYKGLFPGEDPYIWRWPVPMLWVVPVAHIIGRIAGDQAKKDFYARMRYFGHYSNQYAFIPLKLHLRTATKCRNIFALYIRQWAIENDYPVPDHLKKDMFLA